MEINKINLVDQNGNILQQDIPLKVQPPENYFNDATSIALMGGTVTNANSYSYACGNETQANGNYGVAIGLQAKAFGNNVIAIGHDVTAGGVNSFAEGYQTEAVGQASHAEGWDTKVNGDYSHAEGAKTVTGTYANFNPDTLIAATVEENSAGIAGAFSHAEGNATWATSNSTHAEGKLTRATEEAAHSEGYITQANGKYSHAEGFNTTASGESSHTEGNGSNASNTAAHAEGDSTKAFGAYSHAEGQNSQAQGEASHAEGISNIATAKGAHVEGYSNSVGGSSQEPTNVTPTAAGLGAYAHAEGNFNWVTGNGAHGEGYNNYARGANSHAEGYQNKIYEGSAASHVEGSNNQIYAVNSHAEGNGNIIGTENGSKNENNEYQLANVHVGGSGCTVIASNTFAHGQGLNVTQPNCVVIGKYNATLNKNVLFAIGNGENSSNLSTLLEAYNNCIKINAPLDVKNSNFKIEDNKITCKIPLEIQEIQVMQKINLTNKQFFFTWGSDEDKSNGIKDGSIDSILPDGYYGVAINVEGQIGSGLIGVLNGSHSRRYWSTSITIFSGSSLTVPDGPQNYQDFGSQTGLTTYYVGIQRNVASGEGLTQNTQIKVFDSQGAVASGARILYFYPIVQFNNNN